MKKLLATSLTLLMSFGLSAAPALATGGGSGGPDGVESNQTLTITNNNTASINNTITISASTGNNTANGGNGGEGGAGGDADANGGNGGGESCYDYGHKGKYDHKDKKDYKHDYNKDHKKGCHSNSDNEGSAEAWGGNGGIGGDGGRGGIITTGDVEANIKIVNRANYNELDMEGGGMGDMTGDDLDDISLEKNLEVNNSNDADISNRVFLDAATGENTANGGDGAQGGDGGSADAQAGSDDDSKAVAGGGEGGRGGNGGDGGIITTGDVLADILMENDVNHNMTTMEGMGGSDMEFGDDVDDVTIDEDGSVDNDNDADINNLADIVADTGNNRAVGGHGARGADGADATATGGDDDDAIVIARGGRGGDGGDGGRDGDILTGSLRADAEVIQTLNHNKTRIRH